MADDDVTPAPGDEAPDFELPSDDGSTVRFSDLRGRRVVLYFYPKDDTPGCTAQACGFRDTMPAIRDADAVVLGVSPDPVEDHRRFKEKYGLNFPLLADTEHEVAEAYGVWRRKSMFGRRYMGIERSTFVIDEEGTVVDVQRKVKAAEDPLRVLEKLLG